LLCAIARATRERALRALERLEEAGPRALEISYAMPNAHVMDTQRIAFSSDAHRPTDRSNDFRGLEAKGTA
jgi:hypothetical protein